MKSKLIKSLAVVGVVAACTLVVTLIPVRSTVSLTCLEYKRWPHGAMLRLTNGTQMSIWYRAQPNDRAPAYVLKAPDGKVRQIIDICTMPELKPGKAVEFFVGLEPDARPIRVGILYDAIQTPQGPDFSTSELLLLRAKSWLGFKIVPPGQKEAWSKPLWVSSSREPEAGK